MDDLKWISRNPETAYAFVCLCRPPFQLEDDDPEREWDGREFDDDDDDDDDDESSESSSEGSMDQEGHEVKKDDGEEEGEGEINYTTDEYGCSGGKDCLCDEPASEHPDHVWKLTAAGKRKLFAQRIHYQLRCPRYFDNQGFKYQAAYGVLEMLQNLILDFEEADGNHKEQWAVCEALAFFLKATVPTSLHLYAPHCFRAGNLHLLTLGVFAACRKTMPWKRPTS
jgi:hypothetical protein